MDTDHNAATTTEPEVLTAGAVIRRCREFNNISLEDAADTTKIGKNYLRALEEDRPQDLPSPAYLKGFLRTYAAYLGLQAEELIQLATQQHESVQAEPLKSDQEVQSQGGFNWQRLILPALLLTAVIASAIFMVPSTPERPKSPSPQQAPPLAQPSTPAAAVQPVHSSVSTTTNATTLQPASIEIPAEVAVIPKARDGFVVRMKVNRNSSLSVIIDEAAAQGYELTSGDLIEWKATRTIALDLSDASSVDIELNGAPMKLQQVTPGKPAYVILDANGLQH